CLIELRTAVRIARAILLHRANVDVLRTQHFGPAHRRRQEMRVADRYVGNRYLLSDLGASFRNGDLLIRQCRAADGAEKRRPNQQPVADAQSLADSLEGSLLTGFR